MILIANINGFETPIEVPEHAIPQTYVEGDKDSFTVDFGNGFQQVGGIVTIPFKNATEATKTVSLPFAKLLDFQATPIDVQGPLGEATHIEILADNKVRVYARTSQAFTGNFNVKWSASGVV